MISIVMDGVSTFRRMVFPLAIAASITELIWNISAFWKGPRVLIRTTFRATARNQNAGTLNENSVVGLSILHHQLEGAGGQ